MARYAAMRAPRIVLAALATSLALAPAAGAASTRTATDHLTGLKFSLSGKKLSLRITTQYRDRKSAAVTLLPGRGVKVSCGTKAASGKPNSPLVARGSGTWSKTAKTRSFTLSRNVASKASWCLVQASGSIAGYVDLKLGRNPAEDKSA
jgi:hypothetical protein